MQTAANLMPIPGHIDPVPVPRTVAPRPDGRVDLSGLADVLGRPLAVDLDADHLHVGAHPRQPGRQCQAHAAASAARRPSARRITRSQRRARSGSCVTRTSVAP